MRRLKTELKKRKPKIHDRDIIFPCGGIFVLEICIKQTKPKTTNLAAVYIIPKNNNLVIAESSCRILVEAWVEKLLENLEVKRIFKANLDPFFTLGVVSTSAQSLNQLM